MHEVGLAQEILVRAVEAATDAVGPQARIEGLRIRVGELSGVDPQALTLALEVLSRGGPAAGCRLEFEDEPVRLRCPCGFEAGGDRMREPCPACGYGSWEVIEGKGLVLLGVEVFD